MEHSFKPLPEWMQAFKVWLAQTSRCHGDCRCAHKAALLNNARVMILSGLAMGWHQIQRICQTY